MINFQKEGQPGAVDFAASPVRIPAFVGHPIRLISDSDSDSVRALFGVLSEPLDEVL